MNQSFDDLSEVLNDHTLDVRTIMEALDTFHVVREETYQLSFARRGEAGVWFNLVRKTDRLDPLAKRVMTQIVTNDIVDNNDGVTLVDTLVDMALYSLKWISIIKNMRPEHFERWVQEVYCRDTGMTLEEAMARFHANFDQTPENHPDLEDWVGSGLAIYDGWTIYNLYNAINNWTKGWRNINTDSITDEPYSADVILRAIKTFPELSLYENLSGIDQILAIEGTADYKEWKSGKL